ncbi:MAG: co-chaperone GroES [Rickettsiaceae bacterium]|nr:MAG: co-chaperone GroES [Rickettsiaceae bacterium]
MEIMTNFKPLHDRIAVKPTEQDEKTTGGIYIPDAAKEKPVQGEVVAVGQGTRDANGVVHALEIKVGDKIIYGKWSGTEVKIDDQNLMIMKESDVMGIVNKN